MVRTYVDQKTKPVLFFIFVLVVLFFLSLSLDLLFLVLSNEPITICTLTRSNPEVDEQDSFFSTTYVRSASQTLPAKFMHHLSSYADSCVL